MSKNVDLEHMPVVYNDLQCLQFTHQQLYDRVSFLQRRINILEDVIKRSHKEITLITNFLKS